MTHNEMPKDTVEELLSSYKPFEVEGDHSQFTTGIFVDDVEVLKEKLQDALTTAFKKGVEVGRVEERAEINKKYWLNPKRTRSEIKKDNAWNDLGNTLRNGV